MLDRAFEYIPRKPEETVLYGVVVEQLETFLARQQTRRRPVPRQQGSAQYDEKFLAAPKDENVKSEAGGDGEGDENDEFFQDAVRLVLEFGKASTSLLQRRLRIGYGRAAHLIDLMERDGIVGPADGPKPRQILKRPD